MISHPQTAFNLFRELEEGKVIVIDTTHRSATVTATVGRFFLALLDGVVRARADIHEDWRKTLTCVYIDELGAYARNNARHFGLILEACRKQRVAMHVSHQYLSQIDPEIRTPLRACSIKMANPEAEDAEVVANGMGQTHWRFLTNLPKLRMAMHAIGMPTATLVNIPVPNLAGRPLMGSEEFDELIRPVAEVREPEASQDEEPEQTTARQSEPHQRRQLPPRKRGRGKRGKKDNEPKPNQPPREEPPESEDV